MQPVAGRSGSDGLFVAFRKTVQFIGPFADRPDTRDGDDLVVPDAVDVELVRFAIFVFEKYVVFHVVGRILDVRGAVHVAHQMNDVFEVDGHGGIALLPVIFEDAYGGFQSVDGIAAFRVEQFVRVMETGIDRRRVPAVREGIFGGLAVFVHPLGIVDDRVPSEVFFDAFFRSLRQVAFGDLGNCLVPFASPSEDGIGVEKGAAQ